jgi:hypothetical protein
VQGSGLNPQHLKNDDAGPQEIYKMKKYQAWCLSLYFNIA